MSSLISFISQVCLNKAHFYLDDRGNLSQKWVLLKFFVCFSVCFSLCHFLPTLALTAIMSARLVHITRLTNWQNGTPPKTLCQKHHVKNKLFYFILVSYCFALFFFESPVFIFTSVNENVFSIHDSILSLGFINDKNLVWHQLFLLLALTSLLALWHYDSFHCSVW